MSDASQTLYSIRHLAEEFAVTTRTLRFYEEKGLLQPKRHGSSRSYDSADRARLKLILRGKRLGLTLEESSDIITMYQSQGSNRAQLCALLEKIAEKKQQLKIQQKELATMMADLEVWGARCEAELANQKSKKPLAKAVNKEPLAKAVNKEPLAKAVNRKPLTKKPSKSEASKKRPKAKGKIL